MHENEFTKEQLIDIIRKQRKIYADEFNRFVQILRLLGYEDLAEIGIRFKDHDFLGFESKKSELLGVDNADANKLLELGELREQVIGIIRLYGDAPINAHYIQTKIVGKFRTTDWYAVIKDLSHLDGVLKEGLGPTRTYKKLRAV